MSENKKAKFETLALHYGQNLDSTYSCAVPIHRTAAYLFRDAEHARDLFDLKEEGNIYSRIMNPTNDLLEKRLSMLEGGAGAVALSSGTAAVFYSIINLAAQGDEIISANKLYGGTYTMFNDILPNYGIKTHLVDQDDVNNFKKYINDKTKAIYIEAITPQKRPGCSIISIGPG